MTDANFTDPFFAKAIAQSSAEATLFFTPKQFLYLFDRRLKSKSILPMSRWLFRYLSIQIAGLITVPAFITGMSFLMPGEVLIISAIVLINIGFILQLFSISRSSEATYHMRRLSARKLQIAGGWILILGIGLSVGLFNGILQPVLQVVGGNIQYLNSFGLFATATILGILSGYLGTQQLNRSGETPHSFSISHRQVRNWLNRWIQFNGPIEKLLPSPRERQASTPISAEMAHYSFDRAIVCDSAVMAQFLIANNFHFEHNCAVLSVTGYPQTIFDSVLQMLRGNPALQVYVLHDASPRGVGLAERLRTSSQWFADSTATIYDLGLSPGQVLHNPRFFRQQSKKVAQEAQQLTPTVRQQLTVEALAWLNAGYFVELESFTPRRLLRIATQGIGWSRMSGGENRFTAWATASDADDGDWRGMYRASDESFG